MFEENQENHLDIHSAKERLPQNFNFAFWQHSCDDPISYLESSFLTAHGLTKRATLERSIRRTVLIGCWKTMQLTGSKKRPNMADRTPKNLVSIKPSVHVCRCCNNNVFERQHPTDLYGPKATKESILPLLERLKCDINDGLSSKVFRPLVKGNEDPRYEGGDDQPCTQTVNWWQVTGPLVQIFSSPPPRTWQNSLGEN